MVGGRLSIAFVLATVILIVSGSAEAQDEPRRGTAEDPCGFGSAHAALSTMSGDYPAGDDDKGPEVAEAPRCDVPHLRTLLLATAVLSLAVGEHSLESRLRRQSLDWRFGAAEIALGGAQLAIAGYLLRTSSDRTDAGVLGVSSLALGLVIDGAQRLIAGRDAAWRVTGSIEPHAGGALRIAHSF